MADDCIAVGLMVARLSLRRRLTRLFAHRGWNAVACEGAGGLLSSDDRTGVPSDVLVVDIDRLDEIRGATPVVALTYGSEIDRIGAVKADVRAVVDRDDLDEAFLEAVQEVAAGHGWISPTLVRPLLRGQPSAPAGVFRPTVVPVPSQRPGRAHDPALTAREYEVVSLVSKGMNNSEIAGALYIAESTVKFHMSNILQKTGFRNRGQLVARMPVAG
ncbi:MULTISPECIES: response regulator transcription factor [unclassified Streptomyces]|uniref:helix-turn-helix transcriptional regulator n=1 Tax=unclassified Streptomyces TaxID=2593676 RepID=UPI001587ABD5|nr:MULTISPECIES: response regulator transcription factor [unclassified Streptomyces]NUV67125.1 response regulator transcription factor [Streptomyces sp. CAI-121]NUW01050.1 response regulator transcription factor [Streptomyces sp. CAI 127]NUW13243.1 response regulator transcription factor [Streptomyces sp. CAI-68]